MKKDIGSMPGFQSDKLVQIIGKGQSVVEIGSYRGVTARKIAQAGNRVLCIEPFIGGYATDDDRASTEMCQDNDVRVAFLANTSGLNIKLVQQKSEDAIIGFLNAPAPKKIFDVLIIDGSHNYEDVVKDMAWIQLVRPGGLICFHDYGSRHKGVKKAVDEHITGKYKFYKQVCTLMIYKNEAAI